MHQHQAHGQAQGQAGKGAQRGPGQALKGHQAQHLRALQSQVGQQAELALYIGRALAEAGPDGALTATEMNAVLGADGNPNFITPVGLIVVQEALRKLRGR